MKTKNSVITLLFAVFVFSAIGDTPWKSGFFLPRFLQRSVYNPGVVLCPGFDRNEIGIVSDQGEPVVARYDTIGACLKAFGSDPELFRMIAVSYEDLNGNCPGWREYDGETSARDLVQIELQIVRGKTSRSLRVFGDHNFGASLTVFDEKRLGLKGGGEEESGKSNAKQ